jgi:hypothetical protein
MREVPPMPEPSLPRGCYFESAEDQGEDHFSATQLRERDAIWAGMLEEARRERDEAQKVCAEAYQVVGSMLNDLGQFDTERAEKVLDNLSEHRMVHDDVLPWPSFAAAIRGKSEGE